MSKCTIDIPVSQPASAISGRAEAAIRKAGGSFSGQGEAGSFSLPTPVGSVTGNFTIDETHIRVVITEKPMLVGCGMIEAQLRKYLTS